MSTPNDSTKTDASSTPDSRVGSDGGFGFPASEVTLSPIEQFYVWVMRQNAKGKTWQITKTYSIGRLKIVFDWRSKTNLWGRFGGGWNWKFGFQAGGSTCIVSLLIADLRFSLKPNHRITDAEK